MGSSTLALTKPDRSLSAWEDILWNWSKAPGQTEQDMCENAERMIKKAIAASEILSEKDIRVYAQGSYRYKTNVPGESDVDICVECRDSIFYDVPDGKGPSDYGITTPASYPYSQFKNDVGSALISYFGSDAVNRGNKAFDIRENTYRLEADVVPCFEYHWHQTSGSIKKGVAFVPDDSTNKIINWPLQNDANGIEKNSLTNYRFKRVIRALKCLQYEMIENGFDESKCLPSYLIQCLVWNVPVAGFNHTDLFRSDIRYVLAHLYNNMASDEQCKEWGEINELKYLFRAAPPGSRALARAWMDSAWNYIGFE